MTFVAWLLASVIRSSCAYVLIVPSTSQLRLVGSSVFRAIVREWKGIAHHRLLPHARADAMSATFVRAGSPLTGNSLPPFKADALRHLPLADSIVAALG